MTANLFFGFAAIVIPAATVAFIAIVARVEWMIRN